MRRMIRQKKDPEILKVVEGGDLYVYDGNNDVTLSVNRTSIFWGYNKINLKKSWLRLAGMLPTNKSGCGFSIPQEAVIKKITAGRSGGKEDYIFKVCKSYSNESSDVLYEFEVKDNEIKTNFDLNLLVSAGSDLHVYHDSDGNSENPWIWMELAWVAGGQ